MTLATPASQNRAERMTNYSAVRRIAGWLAWQDWRMLQLLVTDQNPQGRALLEIGVHHGKSFVAMAQCAGDRRLYAIDIFDRQEGNIDRSGLGDKDAFLANLRRFGVDPARVTIDERLSNEVAPADVLGAVGPVDLFHIDGGHHIDAVNADLDLALATVSDSGVVAIDDTYRPEWPEVSAAVFAHAGFQAEFMQFAIGFNKSYWCRPDSRQRYQEVLLRDPDLRRFLTRRYAAKGAEVLVYQAYPLPEWGFRALLRWYLGHYWPELYLRLRRR